MSIQHSENQYPILYQADPSAVTTLKSVRDRIHHICRTYVNRTVRIQTLDGYIYEGVIVQCDSGHVYLRIPSVSGQRALFGPSSFYASQEQILTLVLFELLVIVLLS
ncbi:hypothetical protein Q5741_02940 [Paenibacillus sp. JX-17]|uniref:Acetyl-CoA acetyltransferase n=1 Tax=Paenibacillus lacisoli TaxID=3064525 RepID=A0ABT9CBJ9_9BACL|nr:hypothetical protein [Paenibacillus sp. JX-17]MDO7905367.1 hypothetical protein [Paenibacillus sp. JX-17]